jgi:hypothetical protein
VIFLLLESSQLGVDVPFPLAVIHSHDRPSAAERESSSRGRSVASIQLPPVLRELGLA